MSEHKDVTATMPLAEYLRLKALGKLVDDLAAVERSHDTTTLSGYRIKYSCFESLKDACIAARRALGYRDVP